MEDRSNVARLRRIKLKISAGFHLLDVCQRQRTANATVCLCLGKEPVHAEEKACTTSPPSARSSSHESVTDVPVPYARGRRSHLHIICTSKDLLSEGAFPMIGEVYRPVFNKGIVPRYTWVLLPLPT